MHLAKPHLPRAGALLLALLAACVISACGSADKAAAGPGRIVALGDSSATGTGGELWGATKEAGAPSQCGRTSGGYPNLVAGAVTHSQFVSVACDGATTSSLFAGSQGIDGKWIAPQLDALDGSEGVVLLSIGDNNADFGDVTGTCLAHFRNGGPVFGNACSDAFVSGGSNSLIAKGQSIASDVGAALDAIHKKSPKATVFLVGYLDIAPADAAGCSVVEAGQPRTKLTPTDGPVFDGWEQAVNTTLRSTAASHDAKFVDLYAQSAGHTACSAGERWVASYVGGQNHPWEPVPAHPTYYGTQAVAKLVVQAMEAAGIYLGPEARLEPVTFARLHPARNGSGFRLSPPGKGGAAITLDLDAGSRIGLKLDRLSTGRMVGHKCRAKTRKNSHRKPCTRVTPQGRWWKRDLPAGTTKIYITGRNRGKRLKAGRYRVRMISDPLRIGGPASQTFTIAR